MHLSHFNSLAPPAACTDPLDLSLNTVPTTNNQPKTNACIGVPAREMCGDALRFAPERRRRFSPSETTDLFHGLWTKPCLLVF